MPRPHGTPGRYNRGGCRCAPCREANTAAMRRRRRLIAYGQWNGWTDSTGTRRRLQALIWAGWSAGLLARRLGRDRANLRKLLHGRSRRVTPATAEAVRALCRELHIQPPPQATRHEKGAAAKARRCAREHGWVPLAAWDEIDDPAARPVPGWDRDADPAPVSSRNPSGSPVLGAAIRQARKAAGMSQARLALVLEVTQQSVYAWEAAKAIPGEGHWVQLELTLGPLGVVRDRQEAATEDEADAAA